MGIINADHAWSEGEWTAPAAVAIGPGGRLTQPVDAAPAGGSRILLPGMHNLHSHAFQRAMAGRAERRSQAGGGDSFWTWREQMYAVAGRIDPDALRVVATQLYAEMLEAGYTSVCEFHYLHHDPRGDQYEDPAEMSRAIIDAAREAGIGLLLLPVLYMSGGFDGRPLASHQRRFGHEVDDYLRLLQSLGGGMRCPGGARDRVPQPARRA
ncbi:amidohydrolase family protein [Alkalisalibacterium limincola]|uniref:amidohydrolase family protein n=1 Tax=Alkalisalibacterium limincola TaxID=2699169 RepID=UPI002AA2A685|nr:amidohydrolase family protein [Alkalisalibacterium limincola]